MGDTISSLRKPDLQDMHPQVTECDKEFKSLGLHNRDVWALHSSYAAIDGDNSGTIEVKELMAYLGLQPSQFTNRVFRIFDEDGSGELDFREFVVSMWNYCTLAKNALVMFAFDLYDSDNSGVIDIREVELMLKEVYGEGFQASQLAQKVLRHMRMIDGDARLPLSMQRCEVTAEQFGQFCRKHATLLLPAFTMQETLREAVGGKRLWERLSRRRFEVSDGAYISVNQLLESHLNLAQFNEIVEREIAQQAGGEAEFRLSHSTSLHEMTVLHFDKALTNTRRRLTATFRGLASRLASRGGGRDSASEWKDRAAVAAAAAADGQILANRRSTESLESVPEIEEEECDEASQAVLPDELLPSGQTVRSLKNKTAGNGGGGAGGQEGAEEGAFGVKVPKEEALKATLQAIRDAGLISERMAKKNQRDCSKKKAPPSFYMSQMTGSTSSNPPPPLHIGKNLQNTAFNSTPSNQGQQHRRRGMHHANLSLEHPAAKGASKKQGGAAAAAAKRVVAAHRPGGGGGDQPSAPPHPAPSARHRDRGGGGAWGGGGGGGSEPPSPAAAGRGTRQGSGPAGAFQARHSTGSSGNHITAARRALARCDSENSEADGPKNYSFFLENKTHGGVLLQPSSLKGKRKTESTFERRGSGAGGTGHHHHGSLRSGSHQGTPVHRNSRGHGRTPAGGHHNHGATPARRHNKSGSSTPVERKSNVF